MNAVAIIMIYEENPTWRQAQRIRAQKKGTYGNIDIPNFEKEKNSNKEKIWQKSISKIHRVD